MRCCKTIRGGFSFCGVDIAELGLSYAPEKEDTYVYRPTDFDAHIETFDGHDGGYYYGVTRKPKEFTLRCYFEDDALDRGIMERIYSLFRTGKSGKLIFSRRPWCYYYATVTSLPHPELSNYFNGLITITMQATYPFARSDDMYYDPYEDRELRDEKHSMLLLSSTGLVESEAMIPTMSFTNLTTRTSVILHNPGTEFAPLNITASGDAGMGVVIRNNTTNQECRIIAMDKEHTTDVNKSVYIDGMNGCTSLIGLESPKPAFIYHDYGFIHIAPSYPVIRNIYVENGNSDEITLVNTLYHDVIGKYIYVGEWVKIIDQIDGQTLKLAKTVTIENLGRTMITRMNELEIIPDDTMELTRLSFSYKPTYA